ncbi:glutathione S-transferase N-terminal domain-containing protein [Thiohalorhabdus methylotrophus]|uniref:Glutathione S-transferase N-terminal domain-containing protein n=1 Tax=Thiohalorhabdus methylotrophus TaxID=3242694 RepID=A0ABV4TQU0_9GAMM
MPTLYHYPFCPPAQRVRLALGAKGVEAEQIALPYTDLETPIELAGKKQLPVYVSDSGEALLESETILRRLEEERPEPPLFEDAVGPADYEALKRWMGELEVLVDRLRGPTQLGYSGLGDDEEAAEYFRRQVEHRHGARLEELVNARYADYRQFEAAAELRRFANVLAKSRFFSGRLSVADLHIVSEWGFLRWVDGVSPPLDLLYYFERVEDACGVKLASGEDALF